MTAGRAAPLPPPGARRRRRQDSKGRPWDRKMGSGGETRPANPETAATRPGVVWPNREEETWWNNRQPVR